MGTRSYADVPPTAATIALNAYIFGYGGQSLVTPHVALKQLWWTDERIERKVTRAFVVSKLRGEERGFLDRPLAFGEGLTDHTYMEWILDRAKRFFLILAEIGVPEQIFGCIDDSWDDDDLPMTLQSVKSLELAYENDDTLNRKFFDMQFTYLLRELRYGSHIDYGPKEHIPMEYVNTAPPAVTLQAWDRVHFPGRPEEVFMRRKYLLTDKETGYRYNLNFARDVRRAQILGHEHICNVWASYTSEDAGYVLSSFVGEHTLATFIDHRTPAQFMRLSASARPQLLCEWMHCLSDALASIHDRGTAHCAIRPSNILVDRSNRIAYADIGTLRTFQRNKKPYKTESYDYAAPELQICKAPISITSSPPTSSTSAFYKLRKMSSSTSGSSTSSTGSSSRSNSMCAITTSPAPPSSARRSNSMTALISGFSTRPPAMSPTSSFRNFSRHLHGTACPSPSIPTSPMSLIPVTLLPRMPCFASDNLRDSPEAAPEMSDIYSLACVFLDIITFMLRGKLSDFVKHRSTRVLSSGKHKARVDSSFHADPEKIELWMTVLEQESERQGEQIFRGVPELLTLVRRMMAPNARVRPTALEVRDRIQELLVAQSGVDQLCCAHRVWDTVVSETLPQIELAADARPKTLALGYTDYGHHFQDDAASDQVTSPTRVRIHEISAWSRRGSAASNATAKFGAWRKALTRSP